jgi:hypothetical protein
MLRGWMVVALGNTQVFYRTNTPRASTQHNIAFAFVIKQRQLLSAPTRWNAAS